MSDQQRVVITTLPTGVSGLDEVLGGGLPEYSFNLIVGTPGAGKTTLAQQIMFNLATPARPAIYFTVLGEPPLKMLRYQQQFAFFNPARVGDSIHFVDLSDIVLEQDLERVLAQIVREVESRNPGLVLVDSFQTIARANAHAENGQLDLQRFVQHLAVQLTGWQATTFLIGEYGSDELRGNPVFTVADGIFQLSQSVDRNSVVRKFQVLKSRGQATMPGLHTFRITREGVGIFPRMSLPIDETERSSPALRIASGVAGLDPLLGGGIPAGDAILVTGPSGTGKSILGAQFIAAGARAGEPGVIVVFEEHPRDYLRRATTLGFGLEALIAQGDVVVLYIRPLDLSPDETLQTLRAAVVRIGARRVVIDSLSGFELALAPTFRSDFRESLYRLVGALTGFGITVLLTMEIVQSATDLRFSPYAVSFLADDILLLRYVEIAGQLRKSLTVVKMRGSDHSKDLREYAITEQGLVMRDGLGDYREIGSGIAAPRAGARAAPYPGLTASETTVMQALLELGQISSAALVDRTGLPATQVTTALGRIVDLAYAVRLEEATGTVYRPIAQASRGSE